MSATNRGAERQESDLYPTPKASFEPLIPYLKKSVALNGQVFDPAWGDGRLDRWMLEAEIDAWGTDLNDPKEPADFLTDQTHRYCVLTNPPFSLAFEFCQHSLKVSEHTFFLLRLAFLGAKNRREWFRKHEPSALFVLSERPSFVMSVTCAKKCGYKATLPIESERPVKCPTCGDKVKIATSDSADYAWFYWGPLWQGIFHL